MSYFRGPEHSLTAQHWHLKRLHPAGAGRVVKDRLQWSQRIRPHALAHEYLCRLEYCRYWYPKMCVIDPPLIQLAAGRKLPHVRSTEEPVAMCLFLQEEDCWNPSMLLAEVVVPMAYYWLACFEDWLFTGQWHGGGTHEILPDPPATSPVFPADLGLAVIV